MFLFPNKNKYKGGMTLVELLVVLGIIAIMFGITIFDYSSFKSAVSLNNLANDVSLSIRKAQSYSIGARGISGNFNNRYGVNFSTDNNESFAIFTDVNNNKDYDNYSNECNDNDIGLDNECMEKLTIKTGDYIKGFVDKCSSNSNIKSGTLSITFLRPNLDATFKGISGVSDQVGIIISDADNTKSKMICVTSTGQISISNYEQQN